ncbi:MAG: glycosyltransferase, partial [Syntrophaceae bacterium]|nr:glycosyltransferase [Syntrophaceae bacterium]
MNEKTVKEIKPAYMKSSHISVCICTYRRPDLLKRVLEKLGDQETAKLFTYSIIVVDNDDRKSARDIVKDVRNKSSIPVDYYNEPRNSIPLARNMAVKNAKGNYVAFIDDDEFPLNNWLLNLYQTCNRYDTDGVLGPVKPHFEKAPPSWIIKGKFFERPSYKTGFLLHWRDTRTGNVLMKKSIFNDSKNMFNPEFRHGEDKEFFKRMIEKGYSFIWCKEAPVYETQTSNRFTRTYLLKRALV